MKKENVTGGRVMGDNEGKGEESGDGEKGEIVEG